MSSSSFALFPDVAERFPGADIRLVVARGFDNSVVWPHVDTAVDQLEEAASEGRLPEPSEDEPAIASWHEAFRAFGTNPRRTKPSVHALLRRVAKSGKLPRITPAVDAYNAVSVNHRVPAGAFDLATIDDVAIRFAAADDVFIPLGEPDVRESPQVGEVVYADGRTVLTRHWNHRDCDLSKVTPETTSAVFILEAVTDAVSGALDAATDQLAALLTVAGASVQTHRLTASDPRVSLG